MPKINEFFKRKNLPKAASAPQDSKNKEKATSEANDEVDSLNDSDEDAEVEVTQVTCPKSALLLPVPPDWREGR